MSQENVSLIKTIAIIGGTGKEGSALAKRWALHGYRVIIGSREAQKAVNAAEELNAELQGDYLEGDANFEAAQKAGLVVLSVPYSAHRTTLESIRTALEGKLLIDVTVPVVPPHVRTVTIPEGVSAAQEAQALLGDGVRVVSAFQNVSFTKLRDPEALIDCDVLVTADEEEARQEVIQLVEAAGMRGIDAGPLANAVVAEALTPVLLHINKLYGSKGAGIRITGIGPS